MSLVPQATKATSAPVSQSIIKSKGDWFSQLDEQLTQEVAKPVPNQEEVLRSVQLLFEDGQVIELRAPDTKKGTQSGYYDDFQKFAKDTASLSSQEDVPAAYWTIQTVNPALLSRSANRIKAYAKFSTTDAEIIEYRLLPLDCDPVRPAHISSSDEEKDAALRLATAIRTWLSERNIPTILADSGNGYHALVRIQLPVNKDTTALVQGILAGMAGMFDTDVVKVDRKTFNPSRILKAYGTVARKGDHTADRPWRVTSILDFPEGLRTVEENELRSLLAELPKPVQNTDKVSDSEIENKAIKMEFFMAEAGISHRGRMDYMGGFKWQLEACPFNPDHVAPDSFTFISADGPIGFSCSHNSCAENKWKQFRALLEKRIGHRFPFADTQDLRAGAQTAYGSPPAEAPPNKTPRAKIRTAEVKWDEDGLPILPFKYPAKSHIDDDYVLGRHPSTREVDGGWFQRGQVSIVGSSSGGGITTLLIDLFKRQFNKEVFYGHPTYGLNYLVVGCDRDESATRTTYRRMGYNPDSIPTDFMPMTLLDDKAVLGILKRIEKRGEENIPDIVFVEGADGLVEDPGKSQIVAPFMEGLRAIAHHYHIAVILSAGSPKMHIKDSFKSGRDNIFGSQMWTRKADTIITIHLVASEPTRKKRVVDVELRNAPSETFNLVFKDGKLVEDEQTTREQKVAAPEIQWYRTRALEGKTDPTKKWFTVLDLARGLQISEDTARRWTNDAVAHNYIRIKRGKKRESKARMYQWVESATNPL